VTGDKIAPPDTDLLYLSDVLPGFTLTVDDFFVPTSADWQ
jgi:hypothetical protein